jgi:DUF1680 family protein
VLLGAQGELVGAQAEHRAELLDGVTVIRGRGRVPEGVDAWGPLYRPWAQAQLGPYREVAYTLIPYYAWANRGPAAMAVWLPAARP